MIRSSKHSTKYSNVGKIDILSSFLSDYRKTGQAIIDQIWENGYDDFKPRDDKLNSPKYYDYKRFNVETKLSARALSSLTTQIAGVISAATEKRRKCLWMIEKLKSEGKSFAKLAKKTNKNYKLVKPNFLNAKAELSSKCAEIQFNNGKFLGFVRLKSLGKEFKSICIPILKNPVQSKWMKRGTIMGSFLIDAENIYLRYNIERKKSKLGNKVVGIDQGMKTVATFSDGGVTPEKDIHNHSLESIINRISRKKKGSNAFKKAQVLRKGFINWSLNQINFSEFREVRLEKIWNIGYKTRKSRKMSHWTNTLIRDKIKKMAEEAEVPLIEQSSSFRSQRCSNCGSVRKANRKGKEYKCKHCGFSCDADLNASLNHAVDLPEVHWSIRGKGYNLGDGFYWLKHGLFSFDGQELRVPDSH